MRKNLIELMTRAGDTPYDVQRKIGVPRTTTWRFISGGHNEPRSSTVKKWAQLYNVTESQLRGDTPIAGIEVVSEPQELKDMLPPEEYNHLSNVKKMSREARGILYRLSSMLAADEEKQKSAEKRCKEISPNNQLRAGEIHYKSPPTKRRIKENVDETKQTGT